MGEIAKDLFGDPVRAPIKNKVGARGYFAPPGSGPKGETCGSCRHCVRKGRRYLKCRKNQLRWTSGPATDIRARTAACHGWEANG